MPRIRSFHTHVLELLALPSGIGHLDADQYQTLATTRERLDEYISHIKGAAQLVKMRGPSINDTDEGAEMFSMTRNQFLAIRSLTTSVDREDYSWLLNHSCPDAYVSRVASLAITCSEIRMQVDRLLTGAQRSPQKVQAVLDLLRKAQALSKKLAALDQPQNAVWRVDKGRHSPATGQDQDDADVPPGEVYEMHSLYVCMIYCIIWASHLFLTTCIFRCMAWLAAPDEWRFGSEYETTVAMTKRCIADICASLPYACSWNGYNTANAEFAVGVASPSSPSKGAAGMCIFRPAFTAMMSDYATPQQKRYLEGRLRFLADGVGIKQAGVLLKVNLSFPFAPPPLHLRYLGEGCEPVDSNRVCRCKMKQLILPKTLSGTERGCNSQAFYGVPSFCLRSTAACLLS